MTKSSHTLKWQPLAATLLMAATFFLSLYTNRTVFERLPHLEDEFTYLYQARIFAGGQIAVAQPQPRQAYWQPFVVDHSETGLRTGKYTPGWPLLLALGVSMGYMFVVNALFSAVTVALVYRLGAELWSADAGLIAALLVTFSPAAVLLNASLMGHTAALCYATLFIYAYWRIETGRHPLRWGLGAGGALGMLAMTRPLTAIAIALPFILWSGARLLHALFNRKLNGRHLNRGRLGKRGGTAHHPAPLMTLWQTLYPLLGLSAVAIVLALAIPIFNTIASGAPDTNMYTMIWEYDRVGFGECCGRTAPGHMLEKAFRHTRFDLSLTAADLFGWQLDPVTPALQEHLRTQATYWPPTGLSFVLLPFGAVLGVLIGARTIERRLLRAALFAGWLGIAALWCVFPIRTASGIVTDPTFSWLWIGLGAVILFSPLLLIVWQQDDKRLAYTWLLLAVVLGIVLVQMTYWVGSQRYSTRYYYEALTAAALLTAFPLAWLAQRLAQPVVYGALLLVTAFSFYNYTTPRINALYRFNFISPELIDAVNARRMGDTPVVVIVTGETTGEDRVRWRSYGTLMAVTDPYLQNDIVAARSYNADMTQQILDNLGERQVIELLAAGNGWSFADDADE